MKREALPIAVDAKSIDRFLRFCSPEPNTGCWLWLGTVAQNGYAKFGGGGLNGHRMLLAHRFAYTAFVGPVPANLELDHLCRVRCCANPAHVTPKTHRDNMLAGETLPAIGMRRTACPAGHPYDSHDGKGRRCKRCRAKHTRDWYRRARGAA